MIRIRPHVGAAALLFALTSVATAAPLPLPQDALGRVPLDHEDYDKWNSVGRSTLSQDGHWLAFTIRPTEGASTLKIREVATEKEYTVENGSGLQFTFDSKHAIYSIDPDPDLLEKLRDQGRKRSELPKPKLEILELDSGRHVTLHDVRGMSQPREGTGWITYTPSTPGDDETVKQGKSKQSEVYVIENGNLAEPSAFGEPPSLEPQPEPHPETGEKGGEGEEEEGAAKASEEGESGEMAESQKEEGRKELESEKKGSPNESNGKKGKKSEKKKDNGNPLVLRNMKTGREMTYPDVTSHRFSKFGKYLAFATSATDAENDGVWVVDLETSALEQIISGRGVYRSLSWNEEEDQLAFLTDRDDYGPEQPSMSIYHWSAGGDGEARKIISESDDFLPEGWWIAPVQPTFTEDSRRLLFSTQPKPEDAGKTKAQLEKERKAKEKDPVAKLDIWHWKDDALQPQQLLQAERERRRSYRAIYDIEAGKSLQLATEEMPSVQIDTRSSSDFAVGTSSEKYAVMRSWESPGYTDIYLVDLNTGEAELVLEALRSFAGLSPTGKYLTWFDPEPETWYAMSIETRDRVDLGANIAAPLADELNDRPMLSRSYGTAGWIEGDEALFINDRYDIWRVDPTGETDSVCVTGERGRENETTYRYVRLDFEDRFIDPSEPMLLSVFDGRTKQSGYANLDLASEEIDPLILLDERIGRLQKADQGETVVFTRETFQRYPDLWASTMDFNVLERMSWANPQQKNYLWGTAELIDYETTEGESLQGLLYKPDNFDPSKKYPMLVYFYERNSDGLHRYVRPSAGSSSINYSFYVSRGYVLFVPDIPYTAGHPGQSAANAILPGIQTVIDKGFVDPERVGVQGHSWGGYQIAYLVTMTDMFACAEAGAPVTNMTSAYGGIRWASGMSRMFQYERTQSRIGDTLWNARDLYIENSPVFFADKVETPLLMLHNDEDGAVPWYQGIEFFVALRRLEKPAWMLNYNGEAHGLRREVNREDFARRMQQFFDHYLKGAPPAKWMVEGVPAVDKGRDLGFELVQPEPEGEGEETEPAEPAPEVEAQPVSAGPVTAADPGKR